MITFKQTKFDEFDPNTLYEILKLRVDVFCLEQNCLYQELDDKDKQAIHFMSYQDNKLIAYGRVLYDEDKQAYSIGRVITARAFRKQGHSRTLMQQMLNYLKQHYPDQTIVLSAQHYIRGFYQSLGFEIVGDIYDEDGLPHIKMFKAAQPQITS